MCQVEPISDAEFLTQFEKLTLDPQFFNHVGHIRLAWLYINQQGLDVAMKKTFVGIPAYAGSLGALDKFHATITDAIVRIIAKRMAMENSDTWQTFVAQNKDLVENAVAVIQQHYSQVLLDTEQARTEVIQPDVSSI